MPPYLNQSIEKAAVSHRANNRPELKTSELGLAHAQSRRSYPMYPLPRFHVRRGSRQSQHTLMISNVSSRCNVSNISLQMSDLTTSPHRSFISNMCATCKMYFQMPEGRSAARSDHRMHASSNSDVIASKAGPRTRYMLYTRHQPGTGVHNA
jgi:hypothetical protein